MVIDFFYYTAFGVGLLLAWRFHSSRVASALVVFSSVTAPSNFLRKAVVPLAGPGLTAFEAVSFLVPLNFILLAVSRERGVTVASRSSATGDPVRSIRIRSGHLSPSAGGRIPSVSWRALRSNVVGLDSDPPNCPPCLCRGVCVSDNPLSDRARNPWRTDLRGRCWHYFWL